MCSLPRIPRPRATLAGQFLVLQLVVVGLVLAVVAIISVRQSTAEFRTEEGSRMRAVAESLANTSLVRQRIDENDARRVLAPSVERFLSLSGASEISLASPDGRVVTSSDPTAIGHAAGLGRSDVRSGRSWVGDIEDGNGRSVAGHAPVVANDGDLSGLVLVQQQYPSTWQRLQNAVPDLLLFLGLGAGLGVLGSWLLATLIKRRTRGLEPREIATLADHREALVHSIREGVISVGADGRISVLNDSARELLGLSDDVVGRDVYALDLDPQVTDVLISPHDTEDAMVSIGDRVLVLNQRAASSRGTGIGTVTTLRDRTELVSLQSQLRSNLTITDALRAQTHEFTNQLHTISGYVQLGDYEEVLDVIGTLTRQRTQITDHVTERIADRAVAALLIAKTSVAIESGARLELEDGSALEPLGSSMSADLTTVLGNLIDNALDACATRPQPVVRVEIATDASTVILLVTDNGPGVEQGVFDQIFLRGFSTKSGRPEGRGIGLALVRLICTQRGGTVRVENHDGARFVVRIPRDDEVGES